MMSRSPFQPAFLGYITGKVRVARKQLPWTEKAE